MSLFADGALLYVTAGRSKALPAAAFHSFPVNANVTHLYTPAGTNFSATKFEGFVKKFSFSVLLYCFLYLSLSLPFNLFSTSLPKPLA